MTLPPCYRDAHNIVWNGPEFTPTSCGRHIDDGGERAHVETALVKKLQEGPGKMADAATSRNQDVVELGFSSLQRYFPCLPTSFINMLKARQALESS